MKTQSEHAVHKNHDMQSGHYKSLMIMTVLSFICMYILMYSMVDTFSNVVPNINQFYMAGLMAMAMVIIELAVMGTMYMNKKANAVIMGVSIVALIGFYILIRQQSVVTERQFLKSMIPHHAGAILMCEEANIKDPEIKKLCEAIVKSQQQEIAQMKSKLSELKK
jgi:uncharacterized protein (DUF305 family)